LMIAHWQRSRGPNDGTKTIASHYPHAASRRLG
jgi:hypothetical protein